MSAALLLALSACGGGGDSSGAPSSDIGTLAYVVTQCSDTGKDQALFSEHQALHILHGDRDVTVMETRVGPAFTGLGGLCGEQNLFRFGDYSARRGAFQGLAVSPDGAAVVFEVTDDFSPLPFDLPQEQKGFFFVRADGSGLRPLGPPSRLPSFFFLNSGFTVVNARFGFSPDGRMVTFTDTGPDAAGNEAGQVVTLDVYSGERRQVTDLPPGVPPLRAPGAPSVLVPAFVDSQTIGFLTYANPDGLNPTGDFAPLTVSLIDGTLKAVPRPVVLQGSSIDFTFVITGDKPAAISLNVPGQPKNYLPGISAEISELFAVDGANLLQLTNFQREDTGANGDAIFDVDRQTVYFTASADPLLGTNPSKNCQIFSIDRLGSNLRQLTQFSERPRSTSGCLFYGPPIVGCTPLILGQDSRTRLLVFYSSCDPFGTTQHHGAQVFAMHPDGSGLRQLTQTQGVTTQADGTVTRELPGPSAYGPYQP